MISIVLAAMLVAASPTTQHQSAVFKNMPEGCVYFADKDFVACPGRVFDQNFQKDEKPLDPTTDPNWNCDKFPDGSKVCRPKSEAKPDAAKPHDAKPDKPRKDPDDDKEQSI